MRIVISENTVIEITGRNTGMHLGRLWFPEVNKNRVKMVLDDVEASFSIYVAERAISLATTRVTNQSFVQGLEVTSVELFSWEFFALKSFLYAHGGHTRKCKNVAYISRILQEYHSLIRGGEFDYFLVQLDDERADYTAGEQSVQSIALLEKWVDGENYVYPCDNCGDVVRLSTLTCTADGDYVCELCFESEYSPCDDCGKLVRNEELVSVNNGERFICTDCAADNYDQCQQCGKWFSLDRLTEVVEQDGTVTCYCSDCLDDSLDRGDIVRCSNCGCYLDARRADFDHDDNPYCDDCWDNRPHYIGNYHQQYRDFRFISVNSNVSYPKKGNVYLGVEHELPNIGSDFEELAMSLTENYSRICEYDGSVNNGFESISDAMTFKYWKDNPELVDDYMDDVVAAGVTVDDSAGIHVHISTDSMTENQIEKLACFTYDHYKSMLKFGRRNPEKTTYCGYHNCLFPADVWEFRNHYSAVNLGHANQVEIRIFGTTDDASHYWAIIEFCHALVMAVKTQRNIDVPIKWDDVVKAAEDDGRCENFLSEYAAGFEYPNSYDYSWVDEDDVQ